MIFATSHSMCVTSVNISSWIKFTPRNWTSRIHRHVYASKPAFPLAVMSFSTPLHLKRVMSSRLIISEARCTFKEFLIGRQPTSARIHSQRRSAKSHTSAVKLGWFLVTWRLSAAESSRNASWHCDTSTELQRRWTRMDSWGMSCREFASWHILITSQKRGDSGWVERISWYQGELKKSTI